MNPRAADRQDMRHSKQPIRTEEALMGTRSKIQAKLAGLSHMGCGKLAHQTRRSTSTDKKNVEKTTIRKTARLIAGVSASRNLLKKDVI
jgi:hypothetical protein